MKRVLIIAYYFPPIAASGSVRPAAFCRYLPELGWAPTVVTTDGPVLDPPLAVDASLCHGLPVDLDVVRVAHANPNQWLLRIRDRLYMLLGGHRQTVSNNAPTLVSTGDAQKRRGTIRRVLDRALERLLMFPDPQKFWARPALRACEEIIASRRPDVIVSTGGPWTSLLIGKTLSIRHGIPLVADFRDPWATNPYLTYSSQTAQRRAESLERQVCTQAAAIIANTDELAQSFRERYPGQEGRVATITNGYDASLIRQPSLGREQAVDRRLEIAHFGTVYVKRSPLPLFQAVDRLRINQPDLLGRLQLNFTGEWEIKDPVCNGLASKLEEQGLLRRASRVDRDECLARMATSQVLLILQEGTPMQIPAKLYEYIAMRRPLVVLGGVGATASLVQRHRLGVCCANEVGAIEVLLHELLAGRMCLDIPSESEVKLFSYRFLASQFVEVLGRAVRENYKNAHKGNTSF